MGCLGIDDGFQAGHAHHPLLVKSGQPAQAHEWHGQEPGVGDKGGDLSNCEFSLNHIDPPHHQHKHLQDVFQIVENRHQKGTHERDAQRLVQEALVVLGEFFFAPIAHAVIFNHINSGQGRDNKSGQGLQAGHSLSGVAHHHLHPDADDQKNGQHRQYAIEGQAWRKLPHLVGCQGETGDDVENLHHAEAADQAYSCDVIL